MRVALRCVIAIVTTIVATALPQAALGAVPESQPQLHGADAQLSHAKQYDTLRDEILRILDEMHRSEFWTAAALGAVYAWLLSHRDRRYALLIWLGPTIIFVSGIRYFLLFNRVRTIAIYLGRIEENVFGADETLLPGWERYSSQHGGGQWILVTTAMTWVVIFALSLAASRYLRSVMERREA